ncbi:MAG: glycosyl transferase [Methylophaga sp.]|nr:MAG: glycosyl transferase [Methylophaga sp.]
MNFQKMDFMVGIVVIGRNEGERLRICLNSVLKSGANVVYVDSGSDDDSVAVAESLGAQVVELDPSIPFSAARARNDGVKALNASGIEFEYVQFVDGDCEVNDQWIESARLFLEKQPDIAVVSGRLRERYPEKSVYNLLCDTEWQSPTGEATSCGGLAMMRVEVFNALDGYRNDLTAGEEPELCMRIRQKGFKIWRIENEMALHDSAMFHFSQWWNRNRRTGYGSMELAMRFSHPDFKRITRRIMFWAVWALMVFAFSIVSMIGDENILNIALYSLVALWPINLLRIAYKTWRSGKSITFSCTYAWYMAIGIWPQLLGSVSYVYDRLRQRQMRLIEHRTQSSKK